MPLPYHAGKTRIAEPITKLIFNELDAHNESHDKQIKNYAEPFSGMMRVGLEVMKQNKLRSSHSRSKPLKSSKSSKSLTLKNKKKHQKKSTRKTRSASRRHKHTFKKFMVSDINPNVAIFLKALTKPSWLPKPTPITEEKWQKLKQKTTPPSAQRTFYGHTLGFSGMFLRGAQPNPNHNTKKYLQRTRKRLKDLKPYFTSKNFKVENKSVYKHKFKNTVIYCDPPYLGVGATNTSTSWSIQEEKQFWDTVNNWLAPENNNIVLVSGMIKPKAATTNKNLKIETVWKTKFTNTITTQTNNVATYRMEYVFKATRKQ